MYAVDRVAAIVRPTKVMLEWLYSHPSKYDHVTLKNLQKDCIVLLVPAFDGPRQSLEYIKQIYQGIFEAELISWGVPESAWPENRDLSLFHQWFDVDFHSMIYDVAFIEENQQELACAEQD